MLPEYGIDGYIINSHKSNYYQTKEYIRASSQIFKTPYLCFGYDKESNLNPREFDITLHSRLSIDCIQADKLFTGYER